MIARADALAAQCDAASTPALRQASERLPLTDREREIVMLLGQGLSGRAVAERLGYSFLYPTLSSALRGALRQAA